MPLGQYLQYRCPKDSTLESRDRGILKIIIEEAIQAIMNKETLRRSDNRKTKLKAPLQKDARLGFRACLPIFLGLAPG